MFNNKTLHLNTLHRFKPDSPLNGNTMYTKSNNAWPTLHEIQAIDHSLCITSKTDNTIL